MVTLKLPYVLENHKASNSVIQSSALGYQTPAEVFHQVTDVGEQGAVPAKESPLDQTLVSLAGAAGLSLNSTSILSN